MAGPERTYILTAWGIRFSKSSGHFAPLRTECKMPVPEHEMWMRAFHKLVGDRILLMGAPGSKR